MSDYSSKTEDSAAVSSRFEHKSQGMRTQSQNEKRATEESVDELLAQLENEDKTIKIESPYRSAQQTAQKSSAAGSVQRTQSAKTTYTAANQAQARSQAQAKTPAQASKTNTQAAKTQSKVNSVFAQEKAAPSLAGSSYGESVFMNKSDIPAYEIGLISDDYYIPKEIKSGRVSKVSSEQIDELEADARTKKKKTAKKTGKKKKLTPAQKAVKAIIWVAAWLIVFLIAFVCYKITYNVFYDVAVNPDSTTKIEYTVTSDATDESVYEDLSDLGVMNCTEFIYKLRAKVFKADYVEGTYTISDGYNMEKIINILAGYNYSDDDD